MPEGAEAKAARYDRLYPDSLPPDASGQKAERMERLDLKRRKKSGGSGRRYYGVPALPWHAEEQ